MYITWYRSEIGPLILTSDGKNLTGLYIEGQKYFLDGVSDDLEEVDDLEIFWKTKLWLTHYFAGKNPNPRKLQFLPSGTSFRQVVWQERKVCFRQRREEKILRTLWPFEGELWRKG